MELVDGAVVANRFRLNRMLGRGGMGSVWHATHLGLDIPCAVKFIEGEFAALPEAQARFEREAKAAASLRSPHVVQILDHGISEGRPYIAMELLDGEDLGKRLIRVGRLSPPECGAVVMQVCRALTKAHSLGIVHRDLKPDNIFLVRDDDREIAKVLDFGIAKSNTTGIDGSNTKTGAMLGTPYYMSPEQAQGTKAVDYRSDLWSLAVIVFQCMTGRLPFESEALGDLLVKIIVNEMPVPSHFGQVPPGFDQWWAKAASRHPDQRYQSAKELGESLQALLSSAGSTDLMSAGSLRAAIGGPVPHMAHTPQPQPFGHTPASAMAQSVVAGQQQGQGPQPQGVNATTGAPIARTYSGMHDASQVAPKKKNMGVVVAGIGGLVAIVGVVGLVSVLKGSGKGAGGADKTSEVQKPLEPAKTPEPKLADPVKPAEPVKAEPAKTPDEPAKTPEAKTATPKDEPAKTTRRTREGREPKEAAKTAPPATTPPAKSAGGARKPADPDLGF